ncbi:MAG: asparagine synthetase [Thermoproteales archaeon]|nr:asparagine synthetase [Thermoproteales archaeon]
MQASVLLQKPKNLVEIIKIQTTILKSIHDFMTDRGFLQLMPVLTSTVTDPLWPDPGSTIEGTPKIKYAGRELTLTQSMILHKQVAVAMGLDKIYIMSPNIRLEKSFRKITRRHLFEFTQMDFEIKGASMDSVMSLVEDLVIYVLERVKKERAEELEKLGRDLKIPSKPFPRYTSHEMIEKYGKEWEETASKLHDTPFWVTCFKREFYDREDPERPGHYRNYDLIYPEGYGEALSGAEREWEYKRIISRITADGLDPKNFEPYLALAREGLLVPSAGAGIGIERLVRFATGAEHIGDIQPFRRVPGEEIFL